MRLRTQSALQSNPPAVRRLSLLPVPVSRHRAPLPVGQRERVAHASQSSPAAHRLSLPRVDLCARAWFVLYASISPRLTRGRDWASPDAMLLTVSPSSGACTYSRGLSILPRGRVLDRCGPDVTPLALWRRGNRCFPNMPFLTEEVRRLLCAIAFQYCAIGFGYFLDDCRTNSVTNPCRSRSIGYRTYSFRGAVRGPPTATPPPNHARFRGTSHSRRARFIGP